MTSPISTSDDRLWIRAQRYLAAGQHTAARIGCETLLLRVPAHVEARLLLAGILMSEKRLRAAAAQLLEAARLCPPTDTRVCKIALALLRVGEVTAAYDCIKPIMQDNTLTGVICAAIAQVLQSLGEHANALNMIERAVKLGADGADFRYFHATQLIFNGNIARAETELEHCLRIQSGFGRAALSRSRLRKQNAAHQHLDDIRQRLRVADKGGVDHAALEFAQFKELDDLGEYASAWEALQRGNAVMHARMPYDQDHQEAVVKALIALCTQEFLQESDAGFVGAMPIFIIGMPRSGTTLLERILGNHSQVTSAGELDDFPHQLRWQADHHDRALLDPILLERAPSLDYPNIGRRYLAQTQWRAQGKAYFIDKLPPNYLLAGFIQRALPQAHILHMTRDPMDVCFSNYKALFGDTYAYSYHLPSLAAHYRQYQRILQQWHRAMPGRILDVSYAELVGAPEATARRVLDFCGLPFEADCSDITRNPVPVATLSTAQVREGIHGRAQGEWRRYETQLAYLRDALDCAGG
jgi:tetratricopeptide (TPR) repeat protein